MIAKTPWLERQFDFTLPVSAFPLLLERLRGTPARLEDRVNGVAPEVLAQRSGDSWSILEIIGHLIQVEELWMVRLDDFVAGAAALRPASFESGRVARAGFNERPVRGLLHDFRIRRRELIGRLEGLDEAMIARTAHHPRLNRPMRLLDLLVFTAEHDDHHLVRIGEIVRAAAAGVPPARGGSAGQVIASGPRVLLRDRLVSDADSHVRWRTTGEWREFDAPWEQGPPPHTEEQRENLRRRFLHSCSEPLPELRTTAMIVLPDGQPLGWVNRYDSERFPEAYKLGIDICEDEHLNRGLGTEALALWIDYLFGVPTVRRVGLDTWSFNQRMIHVAHKLGFTPEGAARELVQWRDEWLDLHHFGLLRREWEARRGINA
jgi:RimJ/RimL family protein N-acetyltransferase/uncharacterized damage-inducible protein DinB